MRIDPTPARWCPHLAALVAALTLASCLPNTPTAPPDARMPGTYRGTGVSAQPSLADIPWKSFYGDPVLQTLVEAALAKNYNALLAYDAVLAARENLAIVHANEQPAVSGTLSAPYQSEQGDKPASSPSQAFAPALTLGASYEIDLFGKLKSATAASRAQLLATQAAYDTVLWTLIAQVATSYFQLRELDSVLDLSLKAEQQRAEALRLATLRVKFGESSLQDQLQAEQSLYVVSANIPLIRQSIAQTENALAVLAGDYPHAIKRGLPLDEQLELPALPPAGIPSDLLARRPDIRQADETLVAADAQIDVARKLLLPAFTLGASAAVQGQVTSGAFPNLPPILSSLGGGGAFAGPVGVFALLPQLTQAIFTGGALKARVRLSQDQQNQAIVSYLQTVQGAVRDVSNALVAYDAQRAYRTEEERYTKASLESTKLATLRYNEGQTSYLEVLDAQTRAYQAEIDTQQGRLNERLALVQLYLALGGGVKSPGDVSLQRK